MATIHAFGQIQKSSKNQLDTSSITFRDTIFNIAFDSIKHDLGKIIPSNENGNDKLLKHFKYLGTDSIYITKAWTGDPHFICEYPHEILIPNKIYSFTTCFWHEGRKGKMTKVMGFDLSDGNRISFTFTGTYLPTSIQEE